MSSRIRDELVKDLAKKRRAYLSHLTRLLAFVVLGMVVAGTSCQLAICVGLLGMGWIPHDSPAQTITLRIIWTVIPALFAIAGYQTARSSADASKGLVRVPPVAEQIATLRADENLLRGSSEPTTTPEELLRAAQAKNQRPAEELLRAETGTQ